MIVYQKIYRYLQDWDHGNWSLKFHHPPWALADVRMPAVISHLLISNPSWSPSPDIKEARILYFLKMVQVLTPLQVDGKLQRGNIRNKG